jgi:CBS domain-containing protein
MNTLRQAPLVRAFVARSASFGDAARTLLAAGLSAIAVVDDNGRVVGFFTEDDLIAGCFPAYLRELRHTAFTRDDEAALVERLREAGEEPVAEYMSKPETLEIDTSATHVAERFLHAAWGALAIVEDDRFVGMLSQLEFARWLLGRLHEPFAAG